VLTQAKNRQIEPDPPECLLKMSSKSLLMESAEAGQIREVDPTSKSEESSKQLLQELALPEADLTVVSLSHLSENGSHHRREKRLWKHRS
jgi:hypothetical protein